MDLFEIIIFAVIAGSGLISELFKKRRQEQMKRQNRTSNSEQSGYPATPQTTESIDSDLDDLLDSVDESEYEETVLRDIDELFGEVIFGKPSKTKQKESPVHKSNKNPDKDQNQQFERLTSLENRPAEHLYGSLEMRKSEELTASIEGKPAFQVGSKENSSLLSNLDSVTTSSTKSSKGVVTSSRFRSPETAREAIIATEILSKPISKRKESSFLTVRPQPFKTVSKITRRS